MCIVTRVGNTSDARVTRSYVMWLEERLQAAQKRSPKPALLKRAPPQVGEEDIQPSKPLPERRKKSPALQEKSKQSSQRRRLIMEEDDKMFPCNIDPFSQELVY